jgi:hypothetical protein
MSSAQPKISIGLRAQKGGAVVVCLHADRGEPKMLLSTFLAIDPEPYRTAAALPRDEAAAVVAEGRQQQDRLAAAGLQAILEQFGKPAVAGLLVNRAGWITDLIGYSREWAEHIPVAENLGLRDALRFGCRENGIELAELDEKSLPDIDARLNGLGAGIKPWRKEQKLACVAAWMALNHRL